MMRSSFSFLPNTLSYMSMDRLSAVHAYRQSYLYIAHNVATHLFVHVSTYKSTHLSIWLSVTTSTGLAVSSLGRIVALTLSCPLSTPIASACIRTSLPPGMQRHQLHAHSRTPSHAHLFPCTFTEIHPSIHPSVRPSIHPSIHPCCIHPFLPLSCMDFLSNQLFPRIGDVSQAVLQVPVLVQQQVKSSRQAHFLHVGFQGVCQQFRFVLGFPTLFIHPSIHPFLPSLLVVCLLSNQLLPSCR